MVGAGDATSRLKTGENVTVSCAGGEVGTVYAGALPFDVARVDVETDHATSLTLLHDPGQPLEERILREQFGA